MEDGGDLGVRKERIECRIIGSIISGHLLAGLLAVAAGRSGGAAVWGEGGSDRGSREGATGEE